MLKLIIKTDGGARGNPGLAGSGVVFFDEKYNVLKTYKKFLGRATNNQAEYQAVVLALEKLPEVIGKTDLKEIFLCFYLDSELIVQQLNGVYRVKDQELGRLFVKVWNYKTQLGLATFTHIPREENKLADKLVNEAIDEAGA